MWDHVRVKGSIAATLVLYGAVRVSQALAGDQPENANSERAVHTPIVAPSVAEFAPQFISVRPLTNLEAFSETEFRPRKHRLVDVDASMGGRSVIDAPMLKNNSLWQQLGEYRVQDRVRLLTLWQTRGSSLSLQAGKRGSPSLQWSTPWVHREGASRGLFDRLLAVPTRQAGSPLRSPAPRPNNVSLPSKPQEQTAAVSTK